METNETTLVPDDEAAGITPEPAPKKYLTADQAVSYSTEGKDIDQEDVDDVFGGSVRIRSLTAAQAAQVNQGSIRFGNGRKQKTEFSFAASERLKFRYGVAEPQFSDDKVMTLHTTAGPSFQKVLKAISELSGIDEKQAEDDEEQFRGSGE